MKQTKFKLLLIATLVITTVACDKPVKENTVKTEAKEEGHGNVSKVELDNGKRWIANAETTEGINNMIQITKSFTELENAAAYKSLVDTLNSEFMTIFQKCTMKGEAHNQLHNYLFPMKEKFGKLSSDDISESKVAFEAFKRHLIHYEEFFK